MRRGTLESVMLAVLMAVVSGCEEPPPPPRAEAAAEDSLIAPAADDPMLQAPSGGWLEWIADIRVGLNTVNARAAEDRGAALEIVQQLIHSRHGYLVQYFGKGGSAHAGDALEQSIARLTMHMQELTRQLATDASTLPQIAEATTAALAALDDVQKTGTAAKLSATAPRDY